MDWSVFSSMMHHSFRQLGIISIYGQAKAEALITCLWHFKD